MSGKLPMLDLRPQIEALWPELEDAVRDVLRSGRFILGPNVEAFERECAEFLGVEHAVGLASGTDALVIGLRALGIGSGDEVIAPSFTFFATAEAISSVGATPVFADIRPDTFCLDPAATRQAITDRTRAIVPVHLFGHPADMDPIREAAESHGLVVLEDAAQAFGGTSGGRRLGALGDAAAFSFFPSKNLGAFGDGGLLATNDGAIAETARLLRNHGARGRYQSEMLGYCSRLDEIQAAILRVKLRHVDRWNEGRRRVAMEYRLRLQDTPGIAIPTERSGAHHVYHQFTIRVPAGRRDAIRDRLESAGIAAVVYYPTPVHQMPPYAQRPVSLPETDRAAREVLSLPMWPELPLEEIRRVAGVLAAAASDVASDGASG